MMNLNSHTRETILYKLQILPFLSVIIKCISPISPRTDAPRPREPVHLRNEIRLEYFETLTRLGLALQLRSPPIRLKDAVISKILVEDTKEIASTGSKRDFGTRLIILLLGYA